MANKMGKIALYQFKWGGPACLDISWLLSWALISGKYYAIVLIKKYICWCVRPGFSLKSFSLGSLDNTGLGNNHLCLVSFLTKYIFNLNLIRIFCLFFVCECIFYKHYQTSDHVQLWRKLHLTIYICKNKVRCS